MATTCLWHNARLATLADDTGWGLIEQGALLVQDDRLLWVGALDALPAPLRAQVGAEHDLGGALVTPGLVDCHTHLVYGGQRAREFEMRLQGVGDAEIARSGGGIRSTVAATRAASDAQLHADAHRRARVLMAEGVTTLVLLPALAADRLISTRRIRLGGFSYHLALLQLEHDSAFQMHSPFETMSDFLELVIDGFAKGAPQHHHLVVKAHPLEDGRVPLRRDLKRLARQFGVADRVHYVRGGKLAQLLNDARSAVTVNSTAGQQVLWRGIPLKVFGSAVYAQPEFVSNQPLPEFFAGPSRPDNGAYKDYRRYLLETSQIPGGFYSARGRRQLLRHVVDVMLAPEDPYQALEMRTAAPRQQLRVVT